MPRWGKLCCVIGLAYLVSSFAHAFELPQDHDILHVEQAGNYFLPADKEMEVKDRKKKFVKYDRKLYDLAYQTFLANKDLKEGFYLSRSAVEKKPNSFKWRKRYAQVSAWLGYGDISMQQWMYLVKKTNDPVVIKEAIKVAELTFDYPALIKIYQYQIDQGVPVKQVIDGLAKTLTELGEPDKALALLKKYKSPADKSILKLQIELGKLEPALKSLQAERKMKGLSVHNSIEQAQVLFTMTRLKQAFTVLKEVISYAKPDDKDYWNLLAELAWKKNDESIALLSYERLYAAGDTNEILLNRFSQLLQKTVPQRSLQLVLENWRLHPTDDNLYRAASMSHQLKNWPLFYSLFSLLKPDERAKHIDLYILWALDQRIDALAIDETEKAIESGAILPAWLRLAVAQREHNSIKIKKLLEEMKEGADASSYQYLRDAASQIGDVQSAQEYAYRALEHNPAGVGNYQSFQDMMLPHSDYIDLYFDHHQNGPVSGFEDFLRWQYFITPSFYVRPFMERWRTSSNDKSQIINVPGSLDQYGAYFGLKHKRSGYELKIDQRHAMHNYIQAEFDWQTQWDRFLITDLKVAWQEEADETTQLLVGGKKSFVDVGGTYRLTARDSMVASVQINQYHSQDQVYLGSGQNYRLAWLHQFRSNYPDWNMTTYLNVNRYHNSGNTSSLLNGLLPVPATEPLLPRSFYEIGLNVGVGQIFREQYTHSFRPFAEIGVFNHSVNGIGEVATAGIAGSVFGRDHLVLYGNFSRGEEAAGQIDYSVGLEYKLYY
jgi:hypothetical protein